MHILFHIFRRHKNDISATEYVNTLRSSSDTRKSSICSSRHLHIAPDCLTRPKNKLSFSRWQIDFVKCKLIFPLQNMVFRDISVGGGATQCVTINGMNTMMNAEWEMLPTSLEVKYMQIYVTFMKWYFYF